MRLLLGSGGFRTPERLESLCGAMREHFGSVRRILFVPYALADHDRYVALMIERGFSAGYELEGIHRKPDPVRAVLEAEAIYIGGGNSFRLIDELQRRELLAPIRARALAGVPFMGVSAGSNVACPTIMTTNDMPIVRPSSFEALGLVPFQINPHYFAGQVHVKTDAGYVEHFGETRDDRIREFHEMNERTVVGLWEAGMLHVTQGRVRLTGAPARIFEKGAPPVDQVPGADLSALLTSRPRASTS